MRNLIKSFADKFSRVGDAIYFLKDVIKVIFSGKVRWHDVLSQMYDQGVQSIIIIILTSLASGTVLALQGFVTLEKFGAKEFIPRLVALSLVRELGPVFTALIFSGKSGAGITAELGTMNTHDQIQATRAMGVNPIELLVVPRFLACMLVLPVLVVISEFVGISGGYLIGVSQANLPGAFYWNETLGSIDYVDFFSGLIKAYCFSFIIAWICTFKGFYTTGGALGVGRFTTQAVAYSYIAVIISNAVLTKILLTIWG